jgi:hypothetical protein
MVRWRTALSVCTIAHRREVLRCGAVQSSHAGRSDPAAIAPDWEGSA